MAKKDKENLRKGTEKGNNKNITSERPNISPYPQKPKKTINKTKKLSDLSFQEILALKELLTSIATQNRYDDGDKNLIQLTALLSLEINKETIKRSQELIKNV